MKNTKENTKEYFLLRRSKKSGKIKCVYVGDEGQKSTISERVATEDCSNLNRLYGDKYEYFVADKLGD